MNCPRCGKPLGNSYKCGSCMYEEPTLKKIIYLSNTHFNRGLAKAQIRDLSGAIDALQLSLKYNKRNTEARNLLGLIYFQCGETVEALGQWVISIHFQKRNNIARAYIKRVQNNQGQLQLINNTIQGYNMALKYIDEGNMDLAVIELKKVVNLNPNYIRAYQLLGLLYLKNKQYAAARKVLQRALKLDRNNMTTVRYMDELMSHMSHRRRGAKLAEQKIRRVEIKDPNPIVIQKNRENYTDFNTSTLSFVNILIGVIIGAAVVGVLAVPSFRKTNASEYNQAIVEYSNEISDRNKEITGLQNQIDALTEENDRLNNELGNAGSSADISKNNSTLIRSMRAYLNNDYQTAGTLLADVDRELLDTDEGKNVYDVIQSQTAESVIDSLYQEAMSSFEAKDYMSAADLLKKVVNLAPDDVEARFYLGRAYQLMTDYESARQCYQAIIDNYSDSEYASDAQRYLNELGERAD